MSTCYYLSNRKKREEIQTFNKFWEEKLIPGLKQQIKDYCSESNGLHVNPDFAEQIIRDKISDISRAPEDSASYETEIGTSRWNGKRNLFQWEGSYIEGHIIRDESSLVDFFSNKMIREHYSIVDEDNTEFTLDEFLKKIKYGGE